MPRRSALLETTSLSSYKNKPHQDIIENHHQMIMKGGGINPKFEEQLVVLINNNHLDLVNKRRLVKLQNRLVENHNLDRLISFLKQNDLILTNYNSDEPIITKLDAEEVDSLNQLSSLHMHSRRFLTYIHEYCVQFNLDISQVSSDHNLLYGLWEMYNIETPLEED